MKAVDGAGNESYWSERRSFRVEAAPPGGDAGPLPLALLILLVAILAVIGVPLYILMQKRKEVRELAGYERQLREWEAEDYDVSRLREKYFGKRGGK